MWVARRSTRWLPAWAASRPIAHAAAAVRWHTVGGDAQAEAGASHTDGSDTNPHASDADGAQQTEGLYTTHVPTSTLQKGLLAVGSAVAALMNPMRDDCVATLGETTGAVALKNMRDKMAAHPEGSAILHDRPRVNSETLGGLEWLDALPPHTFGHAYARFMIDQEISPDTRRAVRFVDDEELAYVAQRYREIHDFMHVLLGFNTVSVHDEIAVKWFEAFQTGLPMCYLSGAVGPLSLPSAERQAVFNEYLPWARKCGTEATFVMNVYYEKRFEDDLTELRRELNITLPPGRS